MLQSLLSLTKLSAQRQPMGDFSAQRIWAIRGQSVKPQAMQDFDGELAVMGNTVFCIDSGSANGRVFRSTDAGDSWTMFNTNLTNQKLLSIAILSEKTLYVGTYNGVFRSTEGGKSWTKATTGITDANSTNLVFFRNAIYTVSGDGIFKSVDGGNSWVPMNEGLIASDGATLTVSGGERTEQPSIILWDGATLTVSGGKLYAAMSGSNTGRWNPLTSGVYCLAEDGKLMAADSDEHTVFQ